MGSSTALMVVNLCGWQGAANNTNSKKRTDELIEAAQQEFNTAGIGAKVILGDVNTDLDSNTAMRRLITQLGWTDVASLLAPINNQQYVAKKATRRDFVQAYDLAVIAITSCSVDTQATFDVHSPIAIQMCPRDFSPTVFVARKPMSFDWLRLKQTCTQRMDDVKRNSINIDGATMHRSPANEEIQNLRAALTGEQLPKTLLQV